LFTVRNPSFSSACAVRLGALGLVLLLGLPVRAALDEISIEGVPFRERVETSGMEFRLNAVGLLRYMTVIKAYVAGLYLGPGCDPQAILDDSPKRLEISYFYGIRAADFADATRRGIERNVSGDELGAMQERVDRFVGLYEDVRPGDRYAITYIPGRGTELTLNGVSLGRVEGADFAAAMFAIWFGEEGVDASLKRSLLAGS